MTTSEAIIRYTLAALYVLLLVLALVLVTPLVAVYQFCQWFKPRRDWSRY